MSQAGRRPGQDVSALDPRLAGLLRRIRREQTHMSAAGAAEKLGWSPSKISRIEAGRTGIFIDDMVEMLDMYGIQGPQRDEAIRLAELAADPRLSRLSGVRTGEVYRDECDEAFIWAPQVIPPLLRTPAYAQAVARSLAAYRPETLPSQIAAAGRPAAAWAARLRASRHPLELRAVIAATALRRAVGGDDAAKVMAGQLTHLIQLTARPNVHLRVVSIDADAPAGISAFTLLRFRNPALTLDDVLIEDDDAAREIRAVNTEAVTWDAYRAFQRLEAVADDPAKALAAATAHW